MNCEKGKQLLAGWMDNQLTAAEKAEMEAHLAGCPECQQQLEANRLLWDSMGGLGIPAPSGKMQIRFDAMLETYKYEQENRRPAGIVFSWLQHLFAVRPGFTMAYSLLLVIAGVGLGYLVNRGNSAGTAAVTLPPQTTAASHVTEPTPTPSQTPDTPARAEVGSQQQLKMLTQQVREMREMVMLALLENPSASERIRGVSYTNEISTINKNVLDALLSTLNNDPNSNVRLMTLDALTRYAKVPAVRRGLVQSILQQSSPLVQAAMADVMLRLQERKAVQPLKELLHQKDLNEMVRAKIQRTLTRLI